MCDLPTFEPHIRLLEQWRDFEWRMYLLMAEEKNSSWILKYWHRAHDLDFAVRILKEYAPLPKSERIAKFANIQFPQFPDDLNVPEMD